MTNYTPNAGDIYSFASAMPIARPKIGEATPSQEPQQNGIAGMTNDELPGFSPSRKKSLDLFEEIDAEPTLALVRQVITAPIISNTWTWEKRDGVPDAILESTREVFDALHHEIVTESVTAIGFGDAPCEVVWDVKNKQFVPARLKPLLRQATERLLDKKGNPKGLRNKVGDQVIDLVGPKAFHYCYNLGPKFPYGRSRYCNILEIYEMRRQVIHRLAQYLKKIAGIIVQLHYPDGTSKDANGADRPNDWIAQQVLDSVTRGNSVRFPNLFASLADKNPMQAAELAGKSSWVLSTLETSAANHAEGLLAAIEYFDKLLVRGMLRPERSVLEGQHGTKADASVHSDTGEMDSELLDCDIARYANKSLVNNYLVLNHGEKMRDAVWAVPTKITDDTEQNKMDVLKQLLTNPITAGSVAKKLDVDAIIKDLDITVIPEAEGPIVIESPAKPAPENSRDNKGEEPGVKAMSAVDTLDEILAM